MWADLSPPYSTIVADPPWPYGTGAPLRATKEHRPVSWHLPGNSIGDRYSAMSMNELLALPVADLAADDAHLYLWTTNAFMVEAHQLARAWGFKPKTILTWVKTRPDNPDAVSFRAGYYFRGATEHVVFAVRGTQPLLTKEPHPTAFLWPRIGKHSVKPTAFFDLVETCSPGPYLELFSRSPLLGWDSWGKGYEVAS